MNPRLAKIVTDLLAPWVVILGIAAFVAVRAHAVWYGLILMVTASLAPIMVIGFGAAADKLSDIHVGRREQRKAIFIMLVLLVGGTTAWFALNSAPPAMTALATTMLAVVAAAGLITVIGKFKISMHTAVASGTVVIVCTEVRHDAVATAATAVVGAAMVALIGLAWGRHPTIILILASMYFWSGPPWAAVAKQTCCRLRPVCLLGGAQLGAVHRVGTARRIPLRADR